MYVNRNVGSNSLQYIVKEMSLRLLRSKTSRTETFQANNNLEEYLAQYHLTDVPNPSDDSDFEDTSYKTDIDYENERKRRKREERNAEIQENFERQQQAETYWNKHKNDRHSIFNYRGVKFEHYSHKLISFVFTPSDFDKKFICANRKFRISLKYSKIGWRLKQFQISNKDEILRIFRYYRVDDNNVIQILGKIYEIFVKWTLDIINTRKEKYTKYLNNEDVELNSDDEKLFLSREERKVRRRKIRDIWKRMLPPDTEEDVNSSDNESN